MIILISKWAKAYGIKVYMDFSTTQKSWRNQFIKVKSKETWRPTSSNSWKISEKLFKRVIYIRKWSRAINIDIYSILCHSLLLAHMYDHSLMYDNFSIKSLSHEHSLSKYHSIQWKFEMNDHLHVEWFNFPIKLTMPLKTRLTITDMIMIMV